MPLAYDVTQDLKIPDSAFSSDDIATLLIRGGSYGGEWVMNAVAMVDGAPVDELLGSIHTDADPRPDMAVDTAVIWVNAVCVREGWTFGTFRNLNQLHDEASAPYFAAGMFSVDRRPAPDLPTP